MITIIKLYYFGMKHTIYTIGHSNRTLEDLITILSKYGVKILVDIRRFPTSRKYPWFRRERLEHTLKVNGIKYIWMGEDLGGYREGGYKKYMASSRYLEGIDRLIDISRKDVTAIMCSEKLWFRCHRRHISDTLVSKGLRVIHIIEIDKTYTHRKPVDN